MNAEEKANPKSDSGQVLVRRIAVCCRALSHWFLSGLWGGMVLCGQACTEPPENPNDPSRPEFMIQQVIGCVLGTLQCGPANDGTAPTATTSLSCPANYVLVPANSTVGTTQDFCVAKYEMKCASDTSGLACTGGAGDPPLSQVSNAPWVNIKQPDAITACASLGSAYHLVTSEEWMTIARNIESTPSNWSGGAVNSGNLNRGHSDGDPSSQCDASLENIQTNCSTAGPTGWDFDKRTHTLSNGEVIWDIGGNVWEWNDKTILPADKVYYSVDGGTTGAFREWTQIDVIPSSVMVASVWQASNTSLNSANGIGQYLSGSGNPAAMLRGGTYWDGVAAGIYAMSLDIDTSITLNVAGFRCAYRP